MGGHHDTLGAILTLSERSRNDPAFQHESRDQAVIERALNAVPGREAWRPFEIEVDRTRRGFERQDVGGDWIAVHNLGDEYLYVHAQHAGSEVISVATIADITPYVDGNRRIGPLS